MAPRQSDYSRFFSVGLGAFESRDAVATLPSQLAMLRTLGDAGTDCVVLYRLHTGPDGKGGVNAHFTASAFGPPILSEDLGNALNDLARSTFIRGWNLSGADEPLVLRHKHIREIVPTTIANQRPVPQVREDWASIIDVLRRRGSDTALHLLIEPAGGGAYDPSGYFEFPELNLKLAGTGEDPSERNAAAFFASLRPLPHAHTALLRLRVLLSSTEPLAGPTVAGVARTIFGPTPFRVRTLRLGQWLQAPSDALLLPPEWLLRVAHPPYGRFAGRGLRSGGRRRVDFRESQSDTDGVVLGSAIVLTHREDARREIRLTDQARLRHVHIIGKTGSGKTNLLKNLLRQDLQRSCGIAVIDPHGDLVDYALRHAGKRRDDITLLDFSNVEYLPVLNPLDMDVEDEADRDLAIEELIDIVVQRSFSQWTGPVFEDTVRMTLETLFEPELAALAPPSVTLADRLIRSKASRDWVQRILSKRGSELGDRWGTFNGMLPTTLAENVRWTLSKFNDFSRSGVLRPVVGGGESTVSIKQIVRDRSVLLVKIPEGAIGTHAASFLGSLIFSRIRRAVFEPDSGAIATPFHLYLDEFQRFVDRRFEEIVAEARKFNLGLVVAHQNLRQLDHFSRFEGQQSGALREALFGNVGNRVVMRVAGADVQALATELQVAPEVVRRIEQYEGLASCLIDGAESEPFTLLNDDASKHMGSAAAATAIRRRMVSSGTWVKRDSLDRNYFRAIQRVESAQKRPQLKPQPVPAQAPRRAADHLNELFEQRRIRAGDVRGQERDAL